MTKPPKERALPPAAGITDDSRKVKKGYLFVAVKGLHSDGHDYISEAIKNGAKEVWGEKDPKFLNIPSGVKYKKVADSREALGEAHDALRTIVRKIKAAVPDADLSADIEVEVEAQAEAEASS